MYTLSFAKPVGVEFKISFPTKLAIIQNDNKHSDFLPEMVAFGFELRLPC